MTQNHAIVAVFSHHADAEAAVRKLADAGLDMKHFTIIGKGYHTEEKVVGFYNAGERMKFWGKYGAFWGGIWGMFFGGILFTVPLVGEVVALGHLAVMILGAIEGAVAVGGLSALGAALYSIGIPKDSVLQYEQALKADSFLVVAQGPADEMTRAKLILGGYKPAQLDVHENVKEPEPVTTPHLGHTH